LIVPLTNPKDDYDTELNPTGHRLWRYRVAIRDGELRADLIATERKLDPVRTVVLGIALSLFLVFLGLWLLGRWRPPTALLILNGALVGLLTLFFSVCVGLGVEALIAGGLAGAFALTIFLRAFPPSSSGPTASGSTGRT
jgi:hypothetical protein